MKRIIIVGDHHPSAKRLGKDLTVAAKALRGLQVRLLSLSQLKAPKVVANLVNAEGENHLVWFKSRETSVCELAQAAEALFVKVYVVPSDISHELTDNLFDELIRI